MDVVHSAARLTVPRRRWFAICLWLHRWTSLVATPFFLILCLSGLVLIFHEEIDEVGATSSSTTGAMHEKMSLGELVTVATRLRPDLRPWSAGLDKDKPDRAFVWLTPPGASDTKNATLLVLSRETGVPIVSRDAGQGIVAFLLALHSEWFLGLGGQLFGAAIAVLVLVSLLTGVLIYAPFARRVPFGLVRHGRGARIAQLDLHNLVGIVVLGWLTIVTASGVLLAVDGLLLPIWRTAELREMAGDVARPVTFAPLDRVIAAATESHPDLDFRFVYFPGTDFASAGHFTVGMYGRHRFDAQLMTVVLVDAERASVSATRSLPAYLQAVLISAPLHFGNYGGLPLKAFWAANTLGALFVTSNGAWLWWRRRRKRAHGRA